MKVRIEQYIETLLMEEGLPAGVMKRGERFLQWGDLHQLTELPLLPDEMVEVGVMLLRAPTPDMPDRTVTGDPAPTLSEPVRGKLRALVDAADVHAEAALFILCRDVRARAFNRILDERE